MSRRFQPSTAMAVVVANMIGTGVFTSLGFQLLDIRSGFVLLMLWVVGGVVALCGALSYAELGAALPRSGGEYNFLGRIYHPMAGFVSGWVSASIGFAAPTALAAVTFATYLRPVWPGVPVQAVAVALVLALTLVHARSHRSSGNTQAVFTALKVLLILGFCAAAWLVAPVAQPVHFLPQPGDGALLFGGAFAVSLIYVNYAYTGWNAATYISGELPDPQRSLPWVLVAGTAVVTLLYVLLNATFLQVAPMAAMAGRIEIGFVAADAAFGVTGGKAMGVVLALLLVSTVSAMVLAGPRVLQVIGEDVPAFRALARTNADGVPDRAIWLQALLSVTFIATASFESILVFAGFTLGLNTLFAVGGVLVLRWRQPGLVRPFRVPLYPLPPLVFLALTGWTLGYLLLERPVEAWVGVGVIGAGVGAWWLLGRGRRGTAPPGSGAGA